MVVKKSAPRPYEVTRQLAAIRPKAIERLWERYRLAYSIGYSRGRGSDSESRPSGHSDPTGDVASEKENYRRQVAYAAHKVLEMCAAFDAADSTLSRLTGDSPGNERVRHRPGEVPHAMYPEDIESAKKHLKRVARNGRKPGNT